MMHEALSDTDPKMVVWMPAHLRKGQAGTKVTGDGFLVAELDIEANDAADILAKRSVDEHRVPLLIRTQVKDHEHLVTLNAMWLARATLMANDQTDEPHRDTEASRAKAMAAAKAKQLLARSLPPPTATPTFNPQTDTCSSTKLRTVQQGGHTIARRVSGWWCTECRVVSASWSKLAPQKCGGSAIRN